MIASVARSATGPQPGSDRTQAAGEESTDEITPELVQEIAKSDSQADFIKMAMRKTLLYVLSYAVNLQYKFNLMVYIAGPFRDIKRIIVPQY